MGLRLMMNDLRLVMNDLCLVMHNLCLVTDNFGDRLMPDGTHLHRLDAVSGSSF
jgi:hypothetical protein